MQLNLYPLPQIKLSFTGYDSNKPKVSCSQDVYQILLPEFNSDTFELQEEFKALYLCHSNRVRGIIHLASGSLVGVVVPEHQLLASAILTASSGIILCHNHPSGNLKPSDADKRLTQRLISACEYFSFKILDHLIISPQGFFSFADEGLI